MNRITQWMKSTKTVKRITLYGLVGLLIFLLWFSYSVYKQQRWNAMYAVNDMHGSAYLTYESLTRMSSNDYNTPYDLQRRLHNLFSETKSLTRHLNVYEDKRYSNDEHLFLNGGYVRKGLETLKLRYQQDLWDSTDEKYYDKLVANMKELTDILKEDKEDFETPIFAIFNVHQVSEQIKAINRLNYNYVSNHQVTDVKRMSKEKLREEVARQLNRKAEDIRIDIRNAAYNVRKEYHFEIDGELHGEVSPYTGFVTRINHNKRENPDQELTKEEAEKSVEDFLNHIFEGDFNYKISYKGINANRSFSGTNVPDIQIHSFLVTPMNGEYPYLSPFKNQFGVYIDKHTGKISRFSMTSLGDQSNKFFSTEFFNKEFNRNISKEEAAEKLKRFSERDLIGENVDIVMYSYHGTGIIYSRLSGEFELVHAFRGRNHSQQLFVNASGGYLDEPFKEDH